LTREEAATIADEFLLVRDWEFDQGAIPRFLGRFVGLFPDETYDLLLRRIELNADARKNNQPSIQTFNLVQGHISFGSVPAEKRLQLAQDCIARLLQADSGEDLATLFWDLAGYDEASLHLIVNSAPGANDLGVQNIATLIDKAIPRLAFTHTGFVRNLLQHFTGADRGQLVEAFAHQARHFGGGVFAGSVETHMAQRGKQFADQTAAFPDEPGLDDLARALRKFT